MPKTSRKPRRLVLQTAQTLRTIDATCGTLRDLLSQHAHVEVDCSAVSEADLTLVQLLLAARKTAEQSGKRLTLTAPATGALLDALRRGGLVGTHAPDGASNSFWLQTGDAK